MKCIEAIKPSKYYSQGDVIRVKETEADEKVSTGYWKYTPKSKMKSVKAETPVQETQVQDDSKAPKKSTRRSK